MTERRRRRRRRRRKRKLTVGADYWASFFRTGEDSHSGRVQRM
jgi:hypothetical protein